MSYCEDLVTHELPWLPSDCDNTVVQIQVQIQIQND